MTTKDTASRAYNGLEDLKVNKLSLEKAERELIIKLKNNVRFPLSKSL
ncbi:MAG: hypothetical protein QXT45_01400 [Candidatus Bilamarchaeaceae archaeon]